MECVELQEDLPDPSLVPHRGAGGTPESPGQQSAVADAGIDDHVLISRSTTSVRHRRGHRRLGTGNRQICIKVSCIYWYVYCSQVPKLSKNVEQSLLNFVQTLRHS